MQKNGFLLQGCGKKRMQGGGYVIHYFVGPSPSQHFPQVRGTGVGALVQGVIGGNALYGVGFDMGSAGGYCPEVFDCQDVVGAG